MCQVRASNAVQSARVAPGEDLRRRGVQLAASGAERVLRAAAFARRGLQLQRDDTAVGRAVQARVRHRRAEGHRGHAARRDGPPPRGGLPRRQLRRDEPAQLLGAAAPAGHRLGRHHPAQTALHRLLLAHDVKVSLVPLEEIDHLG